MNRLLNAAARAPRRRMLRIAAAATGAALWLWPIAAPHRVVQGYVAPLTAYSAGNRGIDIDAAVGMPVVAPADGVVHFVGVVAGRGVVSITHPGYALSSYEPVSSKLAEGATVHRGEVIGVVAEPGPSPHCAASCLHFGVRYFGEYVSPMKYLGGVPRAVLLPLSPE